MLLYDKFLTPLIPLLRLLHLHPSSSQLHRRLLYDDSRGVAEPLNETSDIFPDGLVVRGRLLLSLERPASAADIHRLLAQEMVLQPLLTFTDGDLHPNTKLEVRHIHSNINYFNFILIFIVTASLFDALPKSVCTKCMTITENRITMIACS